MKIQFNPGVMNTVHASKTQHAQYTSLAPLRCDTVSFKGNVSRAVSCAGKKTLAALADTDLLGQKVLLRVDFNVPLKNGQIYNDTRIKAAVPTIEYLTGKGAKVILASHFEDKAGEKAVTPSLKIVAERLSKLLQKPVGFCTETVGPKAKLMADNLRKGGILMLENTRFDKAEKANDLVFATKLANMADVFVNDAFGAAHRAHASNEGVARIMAAQGKPSVMGFLMEKEVGNLSKVLDNPERPLTAIIGGKKVTDKVDIVNNLLDKTLQPGDNMIVGGAMAYAFSKAQGGKIGTSFCPEGADAVAKEIIQKAKAKGVNLVLPNDVIATDKFDGTGIIINDAPLKDIHDGFEGVDAGRTTRAIFAKVIGDSKTILWNGPVGVFENPKFADGTKAVAEAVAEATRKGAVTVVGGGDSVTAIKNFKMSNDSFTHVSTGGGASMEFLEGKVLPGINAIDNAV